MNKALLATSFGMVALFAVSCSTSPKPFNSSLTQGTVQLVLEKGVTTKTQVLQAFGGPNITTRDGEGKEVWMYERNAQSVSKNAAGISLIFASASTSGFESSSRNITLMLKFNELDVLVDFDSRYSSF